MKKTIMLLAVALAVTSGSLAQSMSVPSTDPVKETKGGSTWEGYIVDARYAKEITGDPETAMKRAAEYSRALAVKETAFGLIVDGRWMRFDEASNQKAVEYIKSSKVEKGFRVLAQGTMSGDVLAVTSIKEAPETLDPSIN